MTNQRLHFFLSCLLGITLGCAVSWVVFVLFFSNSGELQPENIEREFGTSELRTAENNTTDSDVGTSRTTEDPTKELNQVLQLTSRYLQSFQLHRMFEPGDEDYLLMVARLASNLSSKRDRDFVQYHVFRRLSAINPVQAHDYVGNFSNQDQSHIMRAIYNEWLHADLESAVAYAQASLSKPMKGIVVRELIHSRYDLSEEVQRSIAARLDLKGHFDLWLAQYKKSVFLDDPESEWYSIIESNVEGEINEDELIPVAESWVRRKGIEVIPAISESLKAAHLRNAVLSRTLRVAAELDARGAFDLARGLPNVNSETMLRQVVVIWGGLDPRGALSAIAMVQSKGTRKVLQNQVMLSWADQDPRSMLESIQLFPEDLRSEAQLKALDFLMYVNPEEAAHHLTDVADAKTRVEVARRVVREWARIDASAALEWVLAQSDFGKDLHMIGRTLGYVAIANPEFALEKAMEKRTSEHEVGPEAFVIEAVARRDVDKAIAMLTRIREGSKPLSYKFIALALVQKDNADRALELAESVPNTERGRFLAFVFSQWAQRNREDMLQHLEQLDSNEIRSYAAQVLMHEHNNIGSLSIKDLSTVKSYLDNEESVELTEREIAWSGVSPQYILEAQGK